MERMTGADAVFLHLETADIPLHTLKVVVLEPGSAGPLTVERLRVLVEPYLGVVRRATQRVHVEPGCGGRPLWVDTEVDLAVHVAETALATKTRTALDEVCARMAEQHLDRSRPLWSMTLVHGLDGGRQAVVVCVHHAIADGVAALNTWLAVTTDAPGLVAPPQPAPARDSTERRQRMRTIARGNYEQLKAVPHLVHTGLRSRRATRAFAEIEHVPDGLKAERTSFNARGAGTRVCASSSLDLALFKAIGQAAGVTLNGVLHAVVAGAMRDEYADRGDRLDVPAVATFGVAADLSDTRRHGNDIAPTNVWLRVDLADPLERLAETARSCVASVDLRRRRGFDLSRRGFAAVPRLVPLLREVAAPRAPRTVNNITTANVAGPRTRRWCGDVAIVDFVSYAVAIAPADVNLTVYSYDGHLSFGLVATPEAMPDPAAFLARIGVALEELVTAVGGDRSTDRVQTDG